MSFFEGSNGSRTHYEVHPGLVPVDTIFLHGNLASNPWWEPALKVWEKNAAQGGKKLPGSLIFAEWRGCGLSKGPRTEADLEMPVLAQDYIELLEHLGVRRAEVVGHSTGGLIALHAMRAQPELFERAVLLDPVSPSGLQITQEILDRFMEASRNREFLTMALAGTIHGEKRPDPELFGRIMDHACGVHPLNWNGVLKVLSRIDYWNEVREIRQPTLVLHGEFDYVLPLDESVRLASSLPEGRFRKLDGQGHSCNVENPERFVEITDRFLFG